MTAVTSCRLSFDEWMTTEEERGHGEPFTENTDYGSFTYEFNDSVISVTKKVAEYITRVESDTVLYFMGSTPKEWLPYVGSKLFSKRSRKLFKGLNDIVLRVEKVGAEYRVVTAPVAIESVFKSLDYDFQIPVASHDLTGYDDETLKSMGYERKDSVIVDWNCVDAEELGVSAYELREKRYTEALQKLEKAKMTRGADETDGNYDFVDKSDKIKENVVIDVDINSEDDEQALLFAIGSLDYTVCNIINGIKAAFNPEKAVDFWVSFLASAVPTAVSLSALSPARTVVNKLGVPYHGLKEKLTHYNEIHAKRVDKSYEEDYTVSYDVFEFDIVSGFKNTTIKNALATGDLFSYVSGLADVFFGKSPESMTKEERKALSEIMDKYSKEENNNAQTQDFSSQGVTIVDIPYAFLEFVVSRSLNSSSFKTWGIYDIAGKVTSPKVKTGHRYSGYYEKESQSLPDEIGVPVKLVGYSNKQEIRETLAEGKQEIRRMVGNGGWSLKWNPVMSYTLLVQKLSLGIGLSINDAYNTETSGTVSTKPGIDKFLPYADANGRFLNFTRTVSIKPAFVALGYNLMDLYSGGDIALNTEDYREFIDKKPITISSRSGELMPSVNIKSTDFITKDGRGNIGDYVVNCSFSSVNLDLLKKVVSAKNIYPAVRLYRYKGNKNFSSTLEYSDTYVDMSSCKYEESGNMSTGNGNMVVDNSIKNRSIESLSGQTITFVAKDFEKYDGYRNGVGGDNVFVVPVFVTENANGVKDTLTFDKRASKWYELSKDPSLTTNEMVQLQCKKVTDVEKEPINVQWSGQLENLHHYSVAYVFATHHFRSVSDWGLIVSLACDGKTIVDEKVIALTNKTSGTNSSYTYFDEGNHTFELSFYLDLEPKSSNFYIEIQPYYYIKDSNTKENIKKTGEKEKLYLIYDDNYVSDKYNTIMYGKDKDTYGKGVRFISL